MTDLPASTLATGGAAPRTVVGAFDADELTKATRRAVTRALAEDLGDRGDLTSRATVPASMLVEGEVVARRAGVVSGLGAMVEAFAAVDDRIHLEVHTDNGGRVIEDQVIATVHGPARSVLAAERTALNFLGHLSGIATETARFQALLEGTGVTVRDTRKTTPGLRLLEKAAVRDGGGGNHRIGLFDAVLVKDNHIQAAGGIAKVIEGLRAVAPDVAVQVEVEDVTQIRELLDHGITDILLDNFTVEEVRHAVARVDGRAALEVSGGINAGNIRDYAEALGEGGRIAVGAITHSAPQLDVALDVVEAAPRQLASPMTVSTPAPSEDAPVEDVAATPPVRDAEPAEDLDVEADVDAGATAAPEAADDLATSEDSSPEEDSSDDVLASADEARASADEAMASADDAMEAAGEAVAAVAGAPEVEEVRPRRRRISSFFSRDDEGDDQDAPEGEGPVTGDAPADDVADDVDDDDAARADVDQPATSALHDLSEVTSLPAAEDRDAEGDQPAEEDSPVVHVTPPPADEPAGATDDADGAVAGEGTSDDGASASADDSEPEPLFGIPTDRIRDAEVEGEPFAWRQSGFRQRRPGED